jgi:hypothetical protein
LKFLAIVFKDFVKKLGCREAAIAHTTNRLVCLLGFWRPEKNRGKLDK